MKRHWSDDELVEQWTLQPDELALIGESKTDHNRLSFAVFQIFPAGRTFFSSQTRDPTIDGCPPCQTTRGDA